MAGQKPDVDGGQSSRKPPHCSWFSTEQAEDEMEKDDLPLQNQTPKGRSSTSKHGVKIVSASGAGSTRPTTRVPFHTNSRRSVSQSGVIHVAGRHLVRRWVWSRG